MTGQGLFQEVVVFNSWIEDLKGNLNNSCSSFLGTLTQEKTAQKKETLVYIISLL